LFGIEISSDILIIAILVQMAIIAILIFTIITKLNRNNPAFASSTKNTELDKKVDKKLTGMQIGLSQILTEISFATKEQKESISKLATLVAAAVADPSADVEDEALKSEATTDVSATPNAFPITKDISYLTKMEPFASATNATSTPMTSAISAKPSTFESELFDRSDDSPIPKSEFLEIDLDHDSMDDPNKDPGSLDSELKKESDVVKKSTYGPTDTKASIKSSDSNLHHHLIGPPDSRNYFHPQTHNHLSRRQHYDNGISSSSSLGENVNEMIHGLKENDINANYKGDNLPQHQNYQETGDSYSEKSDLSPEKNSNPELDKIDKEILNALQRLGGMDNSDDNKNNKNDLGSNNKEKLK